MSAAQYLTVYAPLERELLDKVNELVSDKPFDEDQQKLLEDELRRFSEEVISRVFLALLV